jgi:replicative DNA helicase
MSQQRVSRNEELAVLTWSVTHPKDDIPLEVSDFFFPDSQLMWGLIKKGFNDKVRLEIELAKLNKARLIDDLVVEVPEIEQIWQDLAQKAQGRELIRMLESQQENPDPLAIESFIQSMRTVGQAKPISQLFSMSEIEGLSKMRIFKTGFTTLDKFTKLMKGEYWVLAGETSHGKTQMAINMAVNLCRDQGAKVLFVSLEMTYYQIFIRLVNMLYDLPLEQCDYGNPLFLSFFYKMFIENEWLNNLWVQESPSSELAAVLGYIRQVKPDVAIVDYLQLIMIGGQSGEEKIVNQVTTTLRARAQHQPIIMLSQFSRGQPGEEKITLHRLKGSSAVEQSASVVVFVESETRGLDPITNYERREWNYRLVKNRNWGTTADYPIPMKAYYGKMWEGGAD